MDAFSLHPEAVAVYWDILVDGQRRARPAWSPTRVQSEPGACLPLAVRASWPPFDPAMDPRELEQRLAESDSVVVHIPQVLTTNPELPTTGDTSLADDPLFEPADRPGTRRRRPSLEGQAGTSIVIPSAGMSQPGADQSMLARCLDTLALLDPPPLEVIVVVGDEFHGAPPAEQTPQEPGLPVRVVHRGAGPFDFSQAINCGSLASRGDLVLMLNDDIEAESADWLGRMAAHLNDPTVGAVGSALLYPDRTVQHVGMVIDQAQPLHAFVGYELADTAAQGGDVARDVIAVTGACLLARRRDLLAVGGLSEEFPATYGDVDLCLRLQRTGLRVVVEPAAILVHHESASREQVIEPWEWGRFLFRWGEVADPWYHPAFWRPDEADHRNRNADHLGPIDPKDSWPARTPAIQSRMHESQIHESRMRIPPRIHP